MLLIVTRGDTGMLANRIEGTDVYRLKAAEYRRDVDERELPIYTPADAARFIGVHPTTLSHWLFGRDTSGTYFAPVITPADPLNRLLSFFNLAEAHVLAATRYEHRVKFKAIRTAIDTIQNRYPSKHPLISKDFFTDGKDLFVKTLNENENLSTPGQTNLKPIMDMFLAHIRRDSKGLAERIYPVIKGQTNDRVITIVNGISSGQPIIEGRGVPVFVVYGRYKAGETPKAIAKDFDISESKVQRAIEYVEKRNYNHKWAA